MTSRLRADREFQYAVREEQLTRQAERSFSAYVRQAWPICEPRTPYLHNWHLDAIIEHLEAAAAGQLRRLVINVAPRSGKSLLASVLWPTWLWIPHPEARIICVSYSDALAVQLSADRRRVVQSPWYQQRWGDHVRLVAGENLKVEFHNDRRGRMIATSIGGTVTGKGGNFLIVDDPHNPRQAESDALRTQAIEFFTTSLSTRLDDKRTGVIVVVTQRLHHQDLSAYCLAELGFTHLCLPAVAERKTTIVFPRSGRRKVRRAGSLLWPAREGPKEIAEARRVLGSHAFQAQYQQEPMPRAGIMFKREWWRYYDTLPPLDRWTQSWDMAFKDQPGSDRVVGLVGGKCGADVYLVDRVKGRLSFVASCRALKALADKYPQATRVLIEDAANGPAIVNALKGRVAGLTPVTPQGGKLARAAAIEPLLEAGNVYLPRPTDPQTGRPLAERAWVTDFVDEMAQFPQGAHDDDVDACTQLLLHLQASGRDDWFKDVLRDTARQYGLPVPRL